MFSVARQTEEAEKVTRLCLNIPITMSARKNTNYWVRYCIHFYLVLIWYIIRWHTPKITICREQSFSNPLCPSTLKCLLPWAQPRKGTISVWIIYCPVRARHNWFYVEQVVLISLPVALLFLFHIEHSVHSYSYILQWATSLHFQRPSGKGSREAV